jgi:prefoldin subunit 5
MAETTLKSFTHGMLAAEVSALRARVQELEAENQRLTEALSKYREWLKLLREAVERKGQS